MWLKKNKKSSQNQFQTICNKRHTIIFLYLFFQSVQNPSLLLWGFSKCTLFFFFFFFGHRSITGGQWGLRKTVYLASGRKGHESFCKERGKENSVTAGYGGWTGSEGSGNGNQTPWSVCTPHSGGHTPWYTGIHDNQGTGSTQTWRTDSSEQKRSKMKN